jgi:invasion protein IalB
MTFRSITTALICILLAGCAALVITILANQDVGAQTPAQPNQPRPAPKAPAAKAPAPAPTAAATAPSGPIRTETINYDNWTVTCRDTADGKSKKVCMATIPMRVQQQNQEIVLGAWLIAHNNEGHLVSLVQTTQIDIGVLIAKGVELKLGNGKSYKLNFVDCNPRRCESNLVMDDAVIREIVAAANDRVSVTFWKTDNTEASITLASIKGVDMAIAAIR